MTILAQQKNDPVILTAVLLLIGGAFGVSLTFPEAIPWAFAALPIMAVLAYWIARWDVMVLTWASIIVIMSGFMMQMMFWMSLFGGFGGGGRGRQGGGQAALIMMAVYVGTIAVYFISQILIMTLSRYREYAADRGGSVLTGAPMQLASALGKISNDMYRIPEKDMRQVEHASAFFIIPALKGNKVANLFSSHPPVDKRIERLQNMQRQMERGF